MGHKWDGFRDATRRRADDGVVVLWELRSGMGYGVQSGAVSDL